MFFSISLLIFGHLHGIHWISSVLGVVRIITGPEYRVDHDQDSIDQTLGEVYWFQSLGSIDRFESAEAISIGPLGKL